MAVVAIFTLKDIMANKSSFASQIFARVKIQIGVSNVALKVGINMSHRKLLTTFIYLWGGGSHFPTLKGLHPIMSKYLRISYGSCG